MQKTKLGLTIGALSAVVYFTALFGGYTPLFLLAGYILLFEQNDWLKRVCFKAILLSLVFSVAAAIVNLLPQTLNCISNFVSIFKGYFTYGVVSSIVSVIMNILNLLESILFLMLGFKALKLQDVKISKIDNVIDK